MLKVDKLFITWFFAFILKIHNQPVSITGECPKISHNTVHYIGYKQKPYNEI